MKPVEEIASWVVYNKDDLEYDAAHAHLMMEAARRSGFGKFADEMDRIIDENVRILRGDTAAPVHG